jgi:hypothetical protein
MPSAQPQERALHLDIGALEISAFFFAHKIGAKGHHQRCFNIAAMNAMGVLGRAEKLIGIAKARPGADDDQHAKTPAQFARNVIHDRNIAAMGIEQNHFAHAGAMHALANLDPGPCRRFCG